MKRFLAKVALLLGAALVFTIGINAAYIALNRFPPDHTGKFAEVPDSIQIANLGSSHGFYSFNYDDLENKGFSCFNFSLTAQSLEYDYRVLQQYKDRIAPGATVFVCVSYPVLYGKSEVDKDDFASKNKRYYRFLSDELVREYDPVADFWVTVAPSLDADLDQLVAVFKGVFASYDISMELEWASTADDIDLAHDVDVTYKNHLVTNCQNDDGSMIVNEDAIDALYKIIDLVKSIGAEPVLVTTPLLKEYNDAVDKNVPGVYDDFYGRIDSVVSATGVRYFDYSHDERFSNRHDFFMDADHMNKRGAILFTATLVDDALDLD